MGWLLPSLGRPDRLKSLIESYLASGATTPVALRLTETDPTAPEYRALKIPRNWPVRWGRAVKMAETMEEYFNAFPEEQFYGFLGDDVEFRTTQWDKVLEEKAGDGFIAWGDDMAHHGGLIDHWCTGGKLVREVGFWRPPVLQHQSVDVVWHAIGKGLGLLRYVPEVVIPHLHFFWNKSPIDTTYAEGMKYMTSDASAADYFIQHQVPEIIARVQEASWYRMLQS